MSVINCKQHCPCYLHMIEKRREGAAKTNKGYTKEQRSTAAKKAWETKRKK